MNALTTIIALVLLIGGGFIAYGIIMFFFAMLRAVASPTVGTRVPQTRDAADEIDGMNEGDIHSGPYGYSPNTPYPQTQYGSLFNEDAEWAHEEND